MEWNWRTTEYLVERDDSSRTEAVEYKMTFFLYAPDPDAPL